jgi:hypothetical protein
MYRKDRSCIMNSERGIAVSSVLLILVVIGLLLTVVIRPNIVAMKQANSITTETRTENTLDVLARAIITDGTLTTYAGDTTQYLLLPQMHVIPNNGTVPSAAEPMGNWLDNQAVIALPSPTLQNMVGGDLDPKRLRYCGWAYAPVINNRAERVFGLINQPTNADTNPQLALLYAADENVWKTRNPDNSEKPQYKCDTIWQQRNTPAYFRDNKIVNYVFIDVKTARQIFLGGRVEQSNLPSTICSPGSELKFTVTPTATDSTVQATAGFECRPTIASFATMPLAQTPVVQADPPALNCDMLPLVRAEQNNAGLRCAAVTIADTRSIVRTQDQRGTNFGLYDAEAYLKPDPRKAEVNFPGNLPVPANITCPAPTTRDANGFFTNGGAVVLQTNNRQACVNVGKLGLRRGSPGNWANACPANSFLIWLPGEALGLSFACSGVPVSHSNWGKITACTAANNTESYGYVPEQNAFYCLGVKPPVAVDNNPYNYLAASKATCNDGTLITSDGGNTQECRSIANVFSRDWLGLQARQWTYLWQLYFGSATPMGSFSTAAWAVNWDPATQNLFPVHTEALLPDPDAVTLGACFVDPFTGTQNCASPFNPVIQFCRQQHIGALQSGYPQYLSLMRQCTGDANFVEDSTEYREGCEFIHHDVRYSDPDLYTTRMRGCLGNPGFTLGDSNHYKTCINNFKAGDYKNSVHSYRDTIQICVEMLAGRMAAAPNPMLNPAAANPNWHGVLTGSLLNQLNVEEPPPDEGGPVDDDIDPDIGLIELRPR